MRRRQRAYDVPPYRFLMDRDVAKAGALIAASNRVLHLADLGLPEHAADSDIVERAADEYAIIVTANGQDFGREIENFQKKQMRDNCHDLFGLLILPNLYEIQVRLLPKLNGQLRFEGALIDWRIVQIDNLSVRLTDNGEVKVNPMSRCQYCRELDPKRLMKKG